MNSTAGVDINRNAELRQFFNVLFPNIDTGYLILWQSNPEKNYKHLSNIFLKDTNLIEQIQHHLDEAGTTTGIHFNIGVYKQPYRKNGDTKADKVYSNAFLIYDIDLKDNPGLTEKTIIQEFKKIGIQITYIINSGNGFHVYILTETADTPEKRELFKQIYETIPEKITGLKIDRTALNLTQRPRIPTSYNVKNNQVKQVKIIYKNEWLLNLETNRYTLKDFKTYFKIKSTKSTTTHDNIKKNITAPGTPSTPDNTDYLIPDCLMQGRAKGNRRNNIINIRMFFNRYYQEAPEEYIKKVIQEYNKNCKLPMSETELQADIENTKDIKSFFKCNYENCKFTINCNYEPGNNIKISNAFINKHLKHLSRYEFLTMLQIIELSNKQYKICKRLKEPPEVKLEDIKNIPERTLYRTIKKLSDKGYIKIINKGRETRLNLIISIYNNAGYTYFNKDFLFNSEITERQFKILILLYRYGHSKKELSITQQTIAKYSNIKQSNIQKTIKELDKIYFTREKKNNKTFYKIIKTLF